MEVRKGGCKGGKGGDQRILKQAPNPAFTLKWSNQVLNLAQKTHIMGVLNVTPDSFADGGQYFQRDKAIEQLEMYVELNFQIKILLDLALQHL